MPPPSVPPSLVRRHGSARAALAARRRRMGRVGPFLERFLAGRDPTARVPHDPVAFVHRYETAADREVAGLVAATLAYGQVPVIQASVGRVLEALGPVPADAVTGATGQDLLGPLDGFVHRWTRGVDVAALLWAAGRMLDRHGSLGAPLLEAWERTGDLRASLSAWTAALAEVDFRPVTGHRAPPPGLRFLLPDPAGGSAAKRLLLFLRWMVRGPDGVDLGLWPLPPRALLVPLDTHTARIGRLLGLTDRKDTSWRTAEEVTFHLAAVDPEDPVRFDFALCHLGIAGDCPSRRDPTRCARCELMPVCRL